MKSNHASKNSTASASQAATQAFSNTSNLSLDRQPGPPVQQEGRRRLTNSFYIKTDRIVRDPDQPRKKFDSQQLQELQASIAERGIKQPLTVRWNGELDKYMIVGGERRFRAAQALDMQEVPCWVQGPEGAEVLIDQIIENWQRSNLEPVETAAALARLRDEFGCSQTEIARQTGKSKVDVSKLLTIHDRVVDSVKELGQQEVGKMSKRHMYNIARLPATQQEDIAEQVIAEGLNSQQTESLVDQLSPKKHIAVKKGLAGRQRRFKTSKADVLMTFTKEKITAGDIQRVIQELTGQVGAQGSDQ